jgi:hypothetical protein
MEDKACSGDDRCGKDDTSLSHCDDRGMDLLIWIQLQVKAVLREMLVKMGMVWCVLGTGAGN